MKPTRLLYRVAILYQAHLPPMKDGIQKPMKPGGYSDSGADIAYQLAQSDISVVTPLPNPSVENDFDWVFPDNDQGIQSALDKGANVLWLNTILYKGHPVEKLFGRDIEIVGQLPKETDLYDDKWVTNNLLRDNGLTVPLAYLVSKDGEWDSKTVEYPCMIKPLRGRGSQGVVLVSDEKEFRKNLSVLFSGGKFGNALYHEKFLTGQEITVTVMPPGKYMIHSDIKEMKQHWSLPAVKRFNHINGIAPFNMIVAVVENSCVLNDKELEGKKILEVYKECEKAANLVNAKAPIRVDCREDENGRYWIFDLNMKPNITGASRPQRQNQDSLSSLAARKIGWTYGDLLINMLEQRWQPL